LAGKTPKEYAKKNEELKDALDKFGYAKTK